MRLLPLLLLLTACGRDPDGDGLSNAQERELGTGIRVRDTDRDGLSDGDEVLVHGTDPTAPDTDLDGFQDGEEVELGTDGTDPLSYPRDRWPDLSAWAPDRDTTWDVGSVVPGFDGLDPTGALVDLDQWSGHVVVLQLTAGTFCNACASDAADAQTAWRALRDDGVVFLHVLVDDDTRDGDVSDGFAATWAERHGLDFPVVFDSGQSAAAGLFAADLYDGTVPFTALLDRQHRLREIAAGPGGLETVLDAATPWVAAPFPE